MAGKQREQTEQEETEPGQISRNILHHKARPPQRCLAIKDNATAGRHLLFEGKSFFSNSIFSKDSVETIWPPRV
jgi:hypothetical protein